MRLWNLKAQPLRFHIALGFLLWSVLPHFSLYFHSHRGGSQEHSHQTLSKSQLELARRLAAIAGEAFGEAALDPTFGLSEENPASRTPLPSGRASLTAAPLLLHAHFQEEPNASLTPWVAGDDLIHVPPAPAPSSSPSRPLCRSLREVQARGPPVLPS